MLLLLALFPMVLADLVTDRVPNGLIVLGIATGLFCSLWQDGIHGVLRSVVSMGSSFFLLFPLFKIGGLGAGDVKMFLTAASFLTTGSILWIIAGAFLIGAVLSVGKLMKEQNAAERLRYFLSYLGEIVHAKQWRLYGEEAKQNYLAYRRNKIHFTLPIFLSVVLWMGGMI